MKSFVGIAVVAFTFGGCSSKEISSPSTGVEVPIVRLRAEPSSFTAFSGFRESSRLVIRDRGAWRSIWDKLYQRTSLVPALPEIDFSNEVIVVAALGERGSGAYNVVFGGATENESGGIDVVVRVISPGNRCALPAVLTQPVDLARVPRAYDSIRFVERKEVVNCE
jgi:hypothetical protein